MSEQTSALSADDVLRDVGYGGFVKALFSRSNDRSKDWTHACLGVATEITELLFATDAVNGLEESGDLRFYGQAVVNLTEEFTGTDFDFGAAEAEFDRLVAVGEVEGTEDAIDFARTDMLDACKRWVGYGKLPDDLMATGAKAVGLVAFVIAHARFGERDVEKSVHANVAKLLLRYKGMKFDANNAVNRDVKAERELLEAAS